MAEIVTHFISVE